MIIYRCLKPVVPVTESREHTDRRHHRLGDRQHNLRPDPELSRTVDLGGFDDGIRHRCPKERAADRHAECGAGKRQDQRPDTIVQSQDVIDHHIACQHAAVKYHRDKDQPRVHRLQLKVPSGNHISHGCIERDRDDRTDYRHQYGHESRPQNRHTLIPQKFIGRRRKRLRDQLITVGPDRFLIRDGDGKHKQQWDHTHHRQNQKDPIEYYIGGCLDLVQRLSAFFLFCHFVHLLLYDPVLVVNLTHNPVCQKDRSAAADRLEERRRRRLSDRR